MLRAVLTHTNESPLLVELILIRERAIAVQVCRLEPLGNELE